jgi:hypothetical protein
MRNVHICRKKALGVKAKGDLVIVPGQLSLEELIAKIGVVSGVIYVDDLSIMSEIEGKVLDWDKGWDALDALLVAGNKVQLIKEDLYFEGARGTDFKTLQLVSAAIKNLRKRRQVKSVGSYKEKMITGENPSNWKLPDKEFLSLLVSKVKELGVVNACKELGISKQSYYNWKRKELL